MLRTPLLPGSLPRPVRENSKDSSVPPMDLTGQKLYIPNLWPILLPSASAAPPEEDESTSRDHHQHRHHHQLRINPLYMRLGQEVIGPTLDAVFTDGGAKEKNVKEKLGKMFAEFWIAGWLPEAPMEVLETMSVYTIWLFLWDDAIDGAGSPEGVNEGVEQDRDRAAAEAYVKTSLTVARKAILGRDDDDDHDGREEKKTSKVMGLLEIVGARLREVHGVGEEERRELLGLLEEYMGACLVEYRVTRKKRMVGLGEFWGYRLGTSSVGVLLWFCRVFGGDRGGEVKVPKEVRDTEEMRDVELGVNRAFVV